MVHPYRGILFCMTRRILPTLLLLAASARAGVHVLSEAPAYATSGTAPVTGVFAQVTAQAGDWIVAGVAGNKKGNVVAVSLVQTGGSGTTGSQTTFHNDLNTYPTAWLFHQAVTTAGTFDFEWRTDGTFTGSGALYVLRSDNGLIDVAGTAAFDDTDDGYTASNVLDYVMSPAVTNAVAIEAVNTRKDNVTAPAGHDVAVGDGSKRLVASRTNIHGGAWTSLYTLSDDDDAGQTSGAAGLIFAEGTVSAPDIGIAGFSTVNLSAAVLSNTYSATVQKGDVVVMAAAGNKSTAQSLVSFSSSAGSFITVHTEIYPSAYVAYLTAASSGTFDFLVEAATNITASTALYVLRSDTGAIGVVDSNTFENADANAEPDESLAYGSATGFTNALAIEAVSSLSSVVTPQNVVLDANGSNLRLIGHANGLTGSGFTSTYSFTNGVADKMTYSGAGVLFAPIENPPQPPEFRSDPIVKNAFASGYAYSNSIASDALDPNQDPMTFFVEPTNTWLTVAADGSLSGSPQPGDLGTNEWTVFVTDGIHGTNHAILRIEIVDGTPPTPQTSATNFVLILIDDLGWMDLGVQGSEFYETPNIDRLATEGIRFTQAYTAHARCLPARYAIQTGRFPGANGVPAGWPENNLRPGDFTLGEAFQTNGYATAFMGKWHLIGTHDEENLPQVQGWDINITGGENGAPPTYFFPYSLGGAVAEDELNEQALFLDNDTPPGGVVTDRITGAGYIRSGPRGGSGEYITDRLTDEALDWLTHNADRPMFLYLSHYGVHTPFEAPAGLVAKYEAKLTNMTYTLPEYIAAGVGEQKMRQDHPIYAAMIESVDQSVGRILDKLDELGIASNTVVVFFSDNGGLSNRGGYSGRELATANHPLRTGKGWSYEGGIREPMIARIPGLTPTNTTTDAVINGTDFYATFLDLAGLPLRTNDHQDSVSFAEALKGLPYQRGRPIFWHEPESRPYQTGEFDSTAVRDGDDKLVWWYNTPEPNMELYHIPSDPGERTNLVDVLPARAAELRALIEAWYTNANTVAFKVDGDDVARPPTNWLDDPGAPMRSIQASAGMPSMAWDDWQGFDYRILVTTNLVHGTWTTYATGMTNRILEVPDVGSEGFFSLELELQPRE